MVVSDERAVLVENEVVGCRHRRLSGNVEVAGRVEAAADVRIVEVYDVLADDRAGVRIDDLVAVTAFTGDLDTPIRADHGRMHGARNFHFARLETPDELTLPRELAQRVE